MTTMQDRLRAAMAEARGFSQNEISRRAGLASGELTRILNGSKKKEPIAALEKLAKALGVSVEWLRSGTGPMRLPGMLPPTPEVQSSTDTDDPDDDLDHDGVPVLRVRRPRVGRTDIEYVDRYPSRPPVVKSLEGVYEPEVLDALMLVAAHGDDPGEAFWRDEAARLFMERQKAKALVRQARKLDFSMLGSPDNPDE